MKNIFVKKKNESSFGSRRCFTLECMMNKMKRAIFQALFLTETCHKLRSGGFFMVAGSPSLARSLLLVAAEKWRRTLPSGPKRTTP